MRRIIDQSELRDTRKTHRGSEVGDQGLIPRSHSLTRAHHTPRISAERSPAHGIMGQRLGITCKNLPAAPIWGQPRDHQRGKGAKGPSVVCYETWYSRSDEAGIDQTSRPACPKRPPPLQDLRTYCQGDIYELAPLQLIPFQTETASSRQQHVSGVFA